MDKPNHGCNVRRKFKHWLFDCGDVFNETEVRIQGWELIWRFHNNNHNWFHRVYNG